MRNPSTLPPPLQPNNDDVEADGGRRRSAQDLSHLLPLDTGEGETRPGVAHLQISIVAASVELDFLFLVFFYLLAGLGILELQARS